MNKLLLGAVGLVAMATSATAADLAARPYTKAAPVMAAPAYYDWSGFYIGGNGGYGTSRKCFDFAGVSSLLLTTPVRDNCFDATGGVAGGQIGYRWQAAAWVFGLEAQYDWANLTGSAASTLVPALSMRAKIQGLGMYTGQIGYAWNNALLYVKGGAASADDRYQAFTTATNVVVGTASETRWGGTVGVGLEYGFTPNWSLGFEYDHMFLGSRNVTATSPFLIPALYPVERIRQDVDLFTVRLDYHFGVGKSPVGKSPVVARY